MMRLSQREARFSRMPPEAQAAMPRRLCMRCDGKMKSDSTSDPSSTTMTTMGILRMKLPMTPPASSSGQKATMVVSTAKTTGRPTSSVPSTAPCRGSSQSS